MIGGKKKISAVSCQRNCAHNNNKTVDRREKSDNRSVMNISYHYSFYKKYDYSAVKLYNIHSPLSVQLIDVLYLFFSYPMFVKRL